MTVAVVIPCLNEEKYVGKLLDDVTKQTLKPDQVFVVDCHSHDKTVKVAQSFKDSLSLTVLQSPYRSAASARNTGANAARTDYLLFIDADMRLPSDFIAQITNKPARTKQIDFVVARLKSEGLHPVDHMICWAINFWTHSFHMILRRRPAGVGGAMLVSRKLHYLIGGYSPHLREFDDVDYFMRMWRHPVSFAYARKAVAITSNRRHKEQGRLASMLQGMSDHTWYVRRIIRPLMKRLGIKPKWHDVS